MTWQEELRSSLKSNHDLRNFFSYDFDTTPYKVLIPQKFAEVIRDKGPSSPLWKQFLPHKDESKPEGAFDPIGDQNYSQKGQLIHRYPNRALFLPTQSCPIICRYCFRKNELSSSHEIFTPDFEKTLNYLQSHPEIEEIIFSGGDPLILSNKKLDFYLQQFANNTDVKYIRFHTRTPIILPSRITDEFIDLLKKHKKSFRGLRLVIHTNHPDELTFQTRQALEKLKKANLEMLSQTVLLKGINNSPIILKELFLELSDQGVRPYYLHHPDQVKGGMHFYLPLSEGRQIYAKLRNLLPGWGIPQYVIDIPGGEGKVPAFNPEGFQYAGRLINRDSRLVPKAL